MDETLQHHGVKGMKWGVRRTPEQLGHPMSKREANKAIRTAKRTERQRSGTWMSTGKNMNRVYREHKKAVKNDERMKTIEKKMSDSAEKIRKNQEIVNQFELTKDHAKRLSNDPYANAAMRKAVIEQVREQHPKAVKAKESVTKETDRYAKLEDMMESREVAIAKQYTSKYKDAALKDIGIKDVKAGRKMLDDYNLSRKVTRLGNTVYYMGDQ